MNEQLVNQLAESLAGLRRLYEELVAVLGRKLDAMKRADSDALGSCGARERFLAGQIAEVEVGRKQLLGQLQGQLGFDARRGVTISQVAERLDEPARSQLLVLAEGLRHLVTEADRLNQVGALVTKELLVHFRRVYEAMRMPQAGDGLYGPHGGREAVGAERLIDAVG